MLVGGVDEDRVAGALGPHDEHVVLVRADDDLVDAGRPRSRSARGASWSGARDQRNGRRERATLGVAYGNWTGRSSTVDPALWTSATLPPRQRSVTRCAPGSASTWWASSPRSGPVAGRPTSPATSSASSGSGCSAATAGSGWPGPRSTAGGRPASSSRSSSTRSTPRRAHPARISFFGEGLFAPTLIAYGTEEQKRRFLPKIQAVEELWCQGYSEPNAGSDLSNVQTRAVLDGDEWVVNGQKVWTTLAHRADWCFCITRTEPRSPGAQGPLVPPRADAPARRDGPAARADDRHGRVQRGVLRRRPHRPLDGARRGRRRLEGRDGHARLRARHRVPRPAARHSSGADRAHRGRARERRRRRSDLSASASPTRTSASRS